MRLIAVDGIKALFFGILKTESADNAHAREIFPCFGQHRVELLLHLSVHRDADEHDAEHHAAKQRDGRRKGQRAFGVDGKGHDHRAENDKGRAQQQTQRQIETGLYLIDIAGQARHHGRGAKSIGLAVGQLLDVFKQLVPDARGKADCRLG